MTLESYIGLDQGEGMSESAFEAFKDRIKAAAAQIASIKKEESKAKKTEEELIKILVKFIKNSSKTDLVLLMSRALEQNLPANFVLAIVLLANEDIKAEAGHFVMLNEAHFKDEKLSLSGKVDEIMGDSSNSENHDGRSLIFFKANNDALPLKIKIDLDHWLKTLLFQAEETPQKLLKNAYHIEMIPLPKEWEYEETQYKESKKIKPILIALIAHIIEDFFRQQKLVDFDYDKIDNFAEFLITGILNKTAENLENRKLLA
ncbi:MAG: hypothetical protein AAB373_05220 [Patescibacteria group bacterium]